MKAFFRPIVGIPLEGRSTERLAESWTTRTTFCGILSGSVFSAPSGLVRTDEEACLLRPTPCSSNVIVIEDVGRERRR